MDNKYYSEYKSVTWSVAVLCASLLLIYLVLYFAKWDMWKWQFWTWNCDTSTWDVVISPLWDDTQNSWVNQDDWFFMQKDDIHSTWSIDSGSILQTWNTEKTWTLIELSDNDSDSMNVQEIPSMVILSWTKTYYWIMDFVEKLWISYKYALVDEKWIYYLNMWDYKYDFSDIARKLWWNLYIMNTEQELLENWMFGDKVTYINVPEYKNSKVLILLDINNQSWLLAIDYAIYHQVKPYLKSLFITTS